MSSRPIPSPSEPRSSGPERTPRLDGGSSPSPEPGRLAQVAVLTGEVRAGKTTVAQRAVELAVERGYVVGGFLSPDAVRPTGAKVGLDVVAYPSEERRQLARLVDPQAAQADGDRRPAGPRVGPYAFDQAAIDWAIAGLREAIDRRWDLLVADEIGRLELERGEGFAPILPWLAEGRVGRAIVVARLGLHERLLTAFAGLDVRVFRVETSPESRLAVPDEVLDWLCGSRLLPDSAPALTVS